jgi:hypothetical protein
MLNIDSFFSQNFNVWFVVEPPDRVGHLYHFTYSSVTDIWVVFLVYKFFSKHAFNMCMLGVYLGV